MFEAITKFFKNSRNKVVDARAFLGVDWPGSYVDAFRSVPKPGKDKLISEYKGFAYICSNYNARVLTSNRLRLYRVLSKTEKCRWNTRNVSLKEANYLEKTGRISLANGQRLEEITQHPAITLLKRPNPQMSGLTFLEFTQLYQEMVGEGAWHVVYNNLGKYKIPVQLYLLQPQYLKAEEDPKNGFVDHYTYGYKEQLTLDNDEVVRFLLPNLKYPYLSGHSPLLGVFEDVNILDLFKATEAAILNNEGRPDVLVSAKDGIGDPERFEKRFITKFRRGGKAGIMFAEDDITVTPLSWSPKDLAFVKVGETARDSIALAYDIPPALLDKSGSSQYNVDNTLANRHVINAIKPRMERNLDVLNGKFLSLFDSEAVEEGILFMSYDDPSVINKEQELEEDKALVTAGIKLPNEVRIERGYEPKPWGDVPVGMYSQQATDSGPSEGGEAGATDTQKAEEGSIQQEGLNGAQIEGQIQIITAITQGQITPEAGKILLQLAFPLIDEGKLDALIAELGKKKPVPAPQITPEAPPKPVGEPEGQKALCSCKASRRENSPVPKGEAELKKVLKEYFQKQREEVISTLKNKAKSDLPSKFVPMKKWNRELYEQSQPLIELSAKDAYQKQAKQIQSRAGISPDVFSVKNPNLEKKVQELALEFCKETNDSTSEELNKALQDLRESMEEGLSEGERFSQLVDRVGAVFDRAETERAELIASTESSRAYLAGNVQSAKDSGVVSGAKVLLSSDPCPLCEEIAGQGEMDLDSTWYTDPSAPEAYQDKPHPPFHPGCFCDLEFVLSGNDSGAE